MKNLIQSIFSKRPRIDSQKPAGDEWTTNQAVLDDFVVETTLGEGGMGKVYLLRSRSTGGRFAVKRAKGLAEADRRNFLAELQTWIDLPEHANLVPCHFFRTIGDEVAIFAEYVEGGSLKDWIDSRKLYEGGADKTLERILDTAIQFAWGLHCVHELGLVHQDVKPANVLMAKDAQVAVQGLKARVTDYGLARARAAAGERYVPELGRRELANDLAGVYMNKALAVMRLGDNRAAVALYDRAIEIRERLVNVEGRRELAGELARVRAFNGAALCSLGERAAGLEEMRSSKRTLETEIARTGRADLKRVLAWLDNQLAQYST